MRRILLLAIPASLAGCQPHPDPQLEYRGKITLFNFFDEHVDIRQDGKTLASERFDVTPDHESTGFSAQYDVTVAGCSDISIVTKRLRAEESICPKKDGYTIWIQPDRAPHIELDATSRLGLD